MITLGLGKDREAFPLHPHRRLLCLSPHDYLPDCFWNLNLCRPKRMLERIPFHVSFSSIAKKWYQIARPHLDCLEFNHLQVTLFNPNSIWFEMECAFSIILFTALFAFHGQYFKKKQDSFWHYLELTNSILWISMHFDSFG